MKKWRLKMASKDKGTGYKFSKKSSGKTYSLVEIVKAPTTMTDRGPDNTVFAFPIVAILELLIALGSTLFLVLFSLLKDAPLEELANPLITTDPAKAPWYFMGLQEMLEHMHPTLAGIMLPTLAVLFLISLPYIDHSREGAGVWFTSPRGKRIVGWTALYTVFAMTGFVLLDNAFPPRELLRDVLPNLVTQSLIPLTVMTFLVVLPVLVLLKQTKGRKPTAREVMLVLFTVLFFTGVVLTLTGFLFRGPGFHLYLPWDMPNGYNPLDGL
jgi:menaquinol-cytochrome c reductase cytochrome b/c subunit